MPDPLDSRDSLSELDLIEMAEGVRAPDPSVSLDALRLIENLPHSAAVKLVQQHAADVRWVKLARFEVLGLFHLPTEEFEGLAWPALVLVASFEPEGRDAIEQPFAVYFDADGDVQATGLNAVPAEGRRIPEAAHGRRSASPPVQQKRRFAGGTSRRAATSTPPAGQ